MRSSCRSRSLANVHILRSLLATTPKCRLFAVAAGLGVLTQIAPTAVSQDAASKSIPVEDSIPTLPLLKQAVPAVASVPMVPMKPGQKDGNVARYVSKLLPARHVSGSKVDDKISSRALDTYIKMLDPAKLYFLQEDIDSFERYRSQIDDLVLRGDISPAYSIFTKYLYRVGERVQVAQRLIAQDLDFNEAESIIIDPKSMTFAKSIAESDERWKKQIKLSLLDMKDEGKTLEESRDLLSRRYARFAKRWAQTDADELLELYLTSITMGYDPHTTYMSPGSLDDFQIMMRLNLEGIGAALQDKDGYTVVSNVIPGGAADKDGRLKKDDYIVSVGQGEVSEMVDIVESPLKQVVDQIRGKAGTTVRLGVKKGGVGEVEVYQITRAQVELEESAARGHIIEHPLPNAATKLRVGYINLPSFYLDMDGARNNTSDFRSSTKDVSKILDRFRQANVDCVVLDLSRNGGGSLTEAISLTGLFIDRGPVVQVKDAKGNVSPYDDEDASVAWNGPLVVMTSKFSASASEILAGAIKDYKRGLVIGDPATHGKGTVQTLMDLGRELFNSDRENLGALKVTLQQFYLPDGDSTQRNGVAADVILPSISADMDVSEGDLDYALPHDRVKRADHRVYNMVPGNLITTLRQNSVERVAKDTEFMELMRRRELYVRAKAEKTLSLKEDEFMARRKEMDAQKEAEKEELEAEKSTDVVFRDTYYNREVVNVASDYVLGLREQNLAKAR